MSTAPCSPPESWRRPPARGDGALAACGDAPAPLPIDVAALSVGLPDGTYYAGRRLLPWMSFEDRQRLTFSERASSRVTTLVKYREGESIVVRWTIEGGIPGAAEPVMNTYDGDGISVSGAPLRKAFVWDPGVRHIDVYQLPNVLLREVLPEGQERPGARGYYDAIEKITQAFGDAWMLPAIEIRRIAAQLDLLAAERVLDKAIEDAAAEGVDAGELLGWTKQRRGS